MYNPGNRGQVIVDLAPQIVQNRLNGLPVLRGNMQGDEEVGENEESEETEETEEGENTEKDAEVGEIVEGEDDEGKVSRARIRKFMRLRCLLPLAGDCTFIFVCSFTGNTSAVVGDGDDGWIGINELRNQEFTFRFSAGENGTNAKLRESYEPGSFAVWTLVRDGSRVMLYRNGKLATKRSEYISAGTTMNLGLLMGMRPNNVNFKGELAELLIFGTSLSSERRRSVEQYLMDKYSLYDRKR